VCGYLSCDQRFNPLIGALPPLLHVRMRPLPDAPPDAPPAPLATPAAATHVLSIQAGDWLEVTLRHTVEEASGRNPGCAAMLARLTEIVYVEVLRRYMQHLPAEQSGWLSGVRDPVVGQALRLLHAQPERAWSVEELARETAVSRSTLAQRFADLIGESPMRYLAQWRIHLAKQLLHQTALSMGEIARRVGYESEVAFSHAFRRLVGQPPATWRGQSGATG
jgi:AraC-like DNA-binding protein